MDTLDTATIDTLINMDLHDVIYGLSAATDTDTIITILRVPGGWIYHIKGTSTFVPLSEVEYDY